jgi:hypothetical protein
MNDPTRFGPFRAACLAMALLFACFTAVQYNDPDPARWMAIYGSAALVSALGAFRPSSSWLPGAVVAAVALVWSLAVALPIIGQPVAWNQVFATMRMVGPNVEETREALGLLIVAAWMAAIAVRGWRRRPAA